MMALLQSCGVELGCSAGLKWAGKEEQHLVHVTRRHVNGPAWFTAEFANYCNGALQWGCQGDVLPKILLYVIIYKHKGACMLEIDLYSVNSSILETFWSKMNPVFVDFIPYFIARRCRLLFNGPIKSLLRKSNCLIKEQFWLWTSCCFKNATYVILSLLLLPITPHPCFCCVG